MVHSAKLIYNGLTLEYESDNMKYKQEWLYLKHWLQISSRGKKELTFEVSNLTGNRLFRIKLAEFKKTDDFGGRSSDGPKVNLGNEFEEHWQSDTKKNIWRELFRVQDIFLRLLN